MMHCIPLIFTRRLADAGIPDEMVFTMEEINPEMSSVDIVLAIGMYCALYCIVHYIVYSF